MNNVDSEGLGLSIAVYAVAMLCGLALFVLPVYWLNSPAVYENPGVRTSALPGGPSYASHPAEFPLAMLHRQQIVDPAMLVELDAKAQKEPPPRRAHRATQRSYAQARDADEPERRVPSRPFFSLF
jgi:hypothetical protein